MKLEFMLVGVSGSGLKKAFASSIDQDNVGCEPDGSSYARLSDDGHMWITAWSGFVYEILNPDSGEPALVQYNGAARGFLAQNLLPHELRDCETTSAVVVEGSALERHKVETFVHADARLLARAYQLMQTALYAPVEPAGDMFRACLAAAQAADRITRYFRSAGVQDTGTYASAEPDYLWDEDTGYSKDTKPVVSVRCWVEGEVVELRLAASAYLSEKDPAEALVKRVTRWIDRLLLILVPKAA